MSYLNMMARVTIGDGKDGPQVIIPSISEFEIEESVDQTSDQAKITIARNYAELSDKRVLDYIKPGMPVIIECGYDGDLQVEFTGYIKPNGIDANFPIILQCDELAPFRQNNWKKSWSNVSLKTLLETVAPGYTIECPTVQMGKIVLKNVSTYKVLEEIKSKWGFFSSIRGKVLHVGFSYDYSPGFTKKHEYAIGKNVKDWTKLKYTVNDEFNVQIKVTVHQKNGKKLVVTAGTQNKDATVKQYTVGPMSKVEANKIATAQLKKVLYTGFKGTIDGFCVPRTHAGDSMVISNPAQTDQNGTYLIEKVKIKFKEAEIVRENSISYKVG